MVSHEAEIWVLQGIIRHNLAEDELRAVATRHQRINMVPKGYNYPELMRHKYLSREMQEMHERKA